MIFYYLFIFGLEEKRIELHEFLKLKQKQIKYYKQQPTQFYTYLPIRDINNGNLDFRFLLYCILDTLTTNTYTQEKNIEFDTSRVLIIV